MKSLVIYDSNFGNTQKIAETIAKELNSRAVRSKNVSEGEIEEADLLIVGSPIIGWKPSENMGEFLLELKSEQLKAKKVITFDTRVKLFIHGDAAKKIEKTLVDAGAESLGEPEFFYVKGQRGPLLKGEEEKAVAWAKNITSSFKNKE